MQLEELAGCNSATTTSCAELKRIANLPPANLPMVVATTSANPVQAGQIDEHLFVDNALREVNFCGKTYLVKQIILDGVDVVQRIGYLATNNMFTDSRSSETARIICSNIENALSTTPTKRVNGRLPVPFEIDVPKVSSSLDYVDNHKKYRLAINPSFEIDVLTGSVYYVDGYTGENIGPIGNLK